MAVESQMCSIIAMLSRTQLAIVRRDLSTSMATRIQDLASNTLMRSRISKTRMVMELRKVKSLSDMKRIGPGRLKIRLA
jgi:hypothetical protein